jgi:hypothetical protein
MVGVRTQRARMGSSNLMNLGLGIKPALFTRFVEVWGPLVMYSCILERENVWWLKGEKNKKGYLR